MYWFGIGIDPLLGYLEKRLKGIPIISLPISGPAPEEAAGDTIEPVKQEFKVVAYADDVKPAIT